MSVVEVVMVVVAVKVVIRIMVVIKKELWQLGTGVIIGVKCTRWMKISIDRTVDF